MLGQLLDAIDLLWVLVDLVFHLWVLSVHVFQCFNITLVLIQTLPHERMVSLTCLLSGVIETSVFIMNLFLSDGHIVKKVFLHLLSSSLINLTYVELISDH